MNSVESLGWMSTPSRSHATETELLQNNIPNKGAMKLESVPRAGLKLDRKVLDDNYK